jgi:hypothetical protein
MTTNQLTVVSDAQVWSGDPDKNYGGLGKMGVSAGTGTQPRVTYLFFGRPFPNGVTVLSAKLRLYQQGAATGGNRTLTVQRITKAWSESGLTWEDRPAGTGATATKTLGNSSTDGRVWEFDVQALMQQVADGSAFYGIRVTSNLTTPIWFYSKNANVGRYMAVLEVEWSDAPDAPVDCSPTAGQAVSLLRPTFRMDYTDPSGEDGLQAVQVQVSPVENFSAIVADSGVYPTDLPEWTCTTDLTSSVYRWRGRTQDAAGNWSQYSDPQPFFRVDKGVLTLTNPTGTIYTPTPSWSWTWQPTNDPSFPDGQRAFQIWIVDPDDSTQIIWTSGKRTSTTTSFTMPSADRLLLTPGQTYRTILRVWGELARAATPNDPVYVGATSTFTFGTTGASNVSALTPVSGNPFVRLEWTTTSAPDEFVIFRNGKTIATEAAADLLIAGTTTKYRYEDRAARPKQQHTWGVATKNGTSTANPVTTTGKLDVKGAWLFSLKVGDLAVQMAGDPTPEPMTVTPDEDVAIFAGAGSTRAVMISTGVGSRPNRRSFKGTIRAADLAAWERLTARRAITLGLMEKTKVLKVQLYNVTTGDEHEYHENIPVTFDMLVVG